ncbi:MAG: hypothetical protein VB144_10950 [Clostridia bacterium]|nr:hypothetical protein [Clostridia bacterium]
MDRKPRAAVVGSFMMGPVVRAPRRPAKGETLIGTGFDLENGTHPVRLRAKSAATVCFWFCQLSMSMKPALSCDQCDSIGP